MGLSAPGMTKNVAVPPRDDPHPEPCKDEAMLRSTEADACLASHCQDKQLWYHCQKEMQDSRNSSAFVSYNPKGAQIPWLHWKAYRECATAGSCLSLPRWSRQQEEKELVKGSKDRIFFSPAADVLMQITYEINLKSSLMAEV